MRIKSISVLCILNSLKIKSKINCDMKWIITLKSGEKVETIAFSYNRNNQLVIWEVPNSEYYSGRVVSGADIESVKILPQ